MEDKDIRVSLRATPLNNLFASENRSQFQLLKDQNSYKLIEFPIYTNISLTL